MKTRILKFTVTAILLIGALVIIAPLVFIALTSFMGQREAQDAFMPVFSQSENYSQFKIAPAYPTLRYYVKLLFDTPEFFVLFRNSFIQTLSVMLGQVLISIPCAWGFSQFDFKGKSRLFIIYIILMIMPFQVTMVSSYIVLDKLKLIDTLLSIIIPNIFSAFPVFIIVKSFCAIPKSLIESAYIDGAGEFRTFIAIGIPSGLSGIFAALSLSFIECWLNIEAPLTFIKTKSLYTLSLFLPQINADNISLSMVASFFIMIPPLLIFKAGQKYLEQGIIVSGINE